MRATILIWSAVSGLVVGLIAGIMLFAVVVIGSEAASELVPRLAVRVRGTMTVVSLALLPLAGALLGLLEGRLKLR